MHLVSSLGGSWVSQRCYCKWLVDSLMEWEQGPGWVVLSSHPRQAPQRGRDFCASLLLPLQPALVHCVSCAQYIIYLHSYPFCLRELSSFSQFLWWQLISLVRARDQGLGSEEGK